VSKFFRKLPTCILVNDYGPSETHVVTSYRLPRSRDLWPPLPPIGVPVSNTQLYILDSHGNRVPIGALPISPPSLFMYHQSDALLGCSKPAAVCSTAGIDRKAVCGKEFNNSFLAQVSRAS
jgi:hypothetical protein